MKELFEFLKSLKPTTKIVLILCATVVIVASMYFGYFGDLIPANK